MILKRGNISRTLIMIRCLGLTGIVNNPGLRPNLQFNITAPNGNVIKHPANGWRWSKETMDEKFATGELRFSDDYTRVIRRTYLCDMEGFPPSNHWTNLT